ncbi:putative RING finger protein [Porphyridium purpureum]|uniref:Putative RING finger protein n=1 Tax=Porphyridium purpureum TaxID=35688 RepID=A0A5J4YI55_PORPP|nr:putative RING finger protein [Porphyridium purpureum]|eukprot:POR1644..scf297_16
MENHSYEGHHEHGTRVLTGMVDSRAAGLSHCGGCTETSTSAKEQFLAQREREIRAIYSNQFMTMEEKMRETQRLMSAQFLEQQSAHLMNASSSAADEQFEPTYFDAATQKLGCSHYSRNCKLKAACCGQLYACRFCHNDACDHEIDRFATQEVWCMVCRTLQPKNSHCGGCGVQFAHYSCMTCGFFDNDERKSIYHCDKCGMCRIGKGLNVDNFHCDKCDTCVSLETKGRHKCLERALDANCPICSGYLFTSTEAVVFMRCGHTMHAGCFDQYSKTNYVCPLCSKSLSDMTQFYKRLDEVMQNEQLPEEYQSLMNKILCNDCGQKSDARFHFLYHKCSNCAGYNTRVLQTYRGVTQMTSH